MALFLRDSRGLALSKPESAYPRTISSWKTALVRTV
jgi:hypothetical protein